MHKILNTIILTTILTLAITATSPAAWQITLNVTTPDPDSDTGVASNKLTIGIDPIATDAFDNKLDTVAMLKGPIEAYMLHTEYAIDQQKLWRDIRSNILPKEWIIEINSLVEGNTINIKGGIDVPDNLYFTLTDLDKNKEIRIRASSEYSYKSTSRYPNKFLLRVSEITGGDTVGGGGNNSGGSSSTGEPKGGGGCGYIKNIGRDGEYPGGPGSAALNMVILFTPLIWLTIRRVVFSGAMVYVIQKSEENHRKTYDNKSKLQNNSPVSFSANSIGFQ